MWLSFLQAWVFRHFRSMSNKDVWGGYWKRQHPRAMVFVPFRGMSTPDENRDHLDQLDLATVTVSSYVMHLAACPFEEVRLYSGWLRYGTRKVKYLSERVLRQFGYMQTVPRHPHDSAPIQMTLGQISYCCANHDDHVLTIEQLG